MCVCVPARPDPALGMFDREEGGSRLSTAVASKHDCVGSAELGQHASTTEPDTGPFCQRQQMVSVCLCGVYVT